MCSKILVAYATRFGTTKEIANAIGQALRDSGNIVAVRPVADIETVTPYQAVIVGSAVRQGHWLPEAVDFLKQHEHELSHRPVAYFTVCSTPVNGQRYQQAQRYMDAVRQAVPTIQPVEMGVFSGELYYNQLPWPERLALKVFVKAPEGDFRNWSAIRAWARNLRLMPETA